LSAVWHVGRPESETGLIRESRRDRGEIHPRTVQASGHRVRGEPVHGLRIRLPLLLRELRRAIRRRADRQLGELRLCQDQRGPLFETELAKLRRAGRAPSILLSSVTDAYQGAEKKYRLTRGILQALAREPYPGVVGILTKSPLVLRDIELLAAIPRAQVGLTVTTTDDRLSRFLEVRAPLGTRRLETLAALNARGIETYAFVGPLLPHFRYDREALDALFAGLARAGVRSLYVEHINLRPYIQQRMLRALRLASPEVQAVYRDARTDEHRRALDAIVAELLTKHGLTLRLSRVLYHQELEARAPRSN
jgi:DNA repair photolyase